MACWFIFANLCVPSVLCGKKFNSEVLKERKGDASATK